MDPKISKAFIPLPVADASGLEPASASEPVDSPASSMVPNIEGTLFKAQALFLGERIGVRMFERQVAISPLLLNVGGQGWALLFRYGVVVLFNSDAVHIQQFLEDLSPRVSQPYAKPETEEVQLLIDKARAEGVYKDGIVLNEASVERLQVLADILAKSVVLAQYEADVAEVFDHIEPLTAELKNEGRATYRGKELLQAIGRKLLFQHKMVGRIEVSEKPELLWERPDLERLYLRLEDEYELRERHLALERKLELVSETANTLLEVMQTKRLLRVEWYIVALIVAEIMLTLYSLFFSVQK
jgi:uncharacterized Rmd1/YagE family protein